MKEINNITKKIKINNDKNQRLKLFYETKGLSQEEFAKRINASQPYISAVINNKRNVGSNIINKMKFCFDDFNEYWFLTGHGEMLKKTIITTHDNNDFMKTNTLELSNRLNIVMEYLLLKNPKLYKTQSLVAKEINISRPNLSAALKGNEIYLTENIIEKFCKVFPELNKTWLITGEGEMLNSSNSTSEPITNELKEKIYPTTLAVKIVTTRARAGFSDSYYSDEYLEDLPTVLIDADKEYKGKYLAFEVDGDSMEPEYNKGDIVICREVKRDLWQYKLHYKDFDFVIAHGTKGIMLKEITNHNTETGEITCHSLNSDNGHQDFTLNLREIAFLYNVVEHRISGKSKRRNR